MLWYFSDWMQKSTFGTAERINPRDAMNFCKIVNYNSCWHYLIILDINEVFDAQRKMPLHIPHSHSASYLFTAWYTSVQTAAHEAQMCQMSDVGTAIKQNTGEIRFEKPSQPWKCISEIAHDWFIISATVSDEAQRVNKQIRFKRTANQFEVTKKIKHSYDYILVAILHCACLHLMQQFLMNTAPLYTCCCRLMGWFNLLCPSGRKTITL